MARAVKSRARAEASRILMCTCLSNARPGQRANHARAQGPKGRGARDPQCQGQRGAAERPWLAEPGGRYPQGRPAFPKLAQKSALAAAPLEAR